MSLFYSVDDHMYNRAPDCAYISADDELFEVRKTGWQTPKKKINRTQIINQTFPRKGIIGE